MPYEQFSCLPPAGSQERFDAAVIIPTILRPTLVRAVQSVFNQDLRGRIQLLIGVDQRGDSGILETAARECPGNVFLSVFDPGYSTSMRHGGIYSNRFSGALRTILSYAANSKYIAYLDDDDWWGRGHLSGLLSAIAGKDWAFSYRWLVDRETGWPICQDEWDSLGPGKGINQERFGGFVGPSNLLLDKEACHFVMPYWSLSPFKDGTGEDRLVFQELLLHHSWAAGGAYSCFYEMPREVQSHAHHAREFEARKIGWIKDSELVKTIRRLASDAEAMLGAGDFAQAAAACLNALALNPHHAPSLHILAKAQWQAGEKTNALAHITHALEIDDRDCAIVATWKKITTERWGPLCPSLDNYKA